MGGIGELFSKYSDIYLKALLQTWKLTFLAFLIAFVIGVLITVLRVSPITPLRIAGEIYVQIFRNIPGASLLLILAFALPYLKITLSYFTCVLIAASLIPAAFASEYLMAGINTIPVGQIEAGRSLGMTFTQVIFKIVIPQALRASVLQLTNLLVATMLTTALGSQVPIKPPELTGVLRDVNKYSVGGVQAFLISAAMYLVTAVVIGQIGNRIDKKVRLVR